MLVIADMATAREVAKQEKASEIWKKLTKERHRAAENNEFHSHPAKVGTEEAKHIINNLRKIKGRRQLRALLRTLVVYKYFTIEQVITLLQLFCRSENDKIDLLEIFLSRTMGMLNKYALLSEFHVDYRPYVKEFLLDMSFVKEPEINHNSQPPLTVRNLKAKTLGDLDEIQKALHRSRFSSDQVSVVSHAVTQRAEVMNHGQAFGIIAQWAHDTQKMLHMLDFLRYNVTGFTSKEISDILKKVPDVFERVDIMCGLLDYMLDTENRWLILDLAFHRDQGTHIFSRAEEFLTHMSPFPRSSVFGKIRGKRVLFIIPTTDIMKQQFLTSQSELIDRMRFLVRDLTRVLVEQLEPGVYFDIIVYSDVSSSFSGCGLIKATHESVDAACLWLRDLRCRGVADVDCVWADVFNPTVYKELQNIYFVCNEAPEIIENSLDQVTKARKAYLLTLTKDSPKTAVHSVAVFLGKHPEDEIEEVSGYLVRLGNITNGTFVCLVLDNYVRTHQWFTKHVDVQRHIVRKWMGTAFQCLNVASFAVLAYVIVYAHSGMIGGQTCGDVFRKYITYISPSPQSMSMWGLYVILTAVLVAAVSIPNDTNSRIGILGRIDVFLAMHNLLLAVFLISWQNEVFYIALPVIFAAQGCITTIYLRLEVGLRSTGRTAYRERFFVWTPVSVMHMWLIFNCIVVSASVFKSFEWNGFGWQFEWALLGVLGILFASLYFVVKFTDLPGGLTAAYCLISVASAQWNEYRALGVLDENTKLSSSFWLMVFCASGSLIAGCAALVSLGTMLIRLLYKPLWRQRMATNFTVLKQFGNTVMYIAMVFINLLASPWGYKMLGFQGTPPINHRTCGLVARDSDAPNGDVSKFKVSVTIMPHNATFKLFFLVYGWLGFWVILQLLPHESLLRSHGFHQARDRDLNQLLLIRGPTTQWLRLRTPLRNWFRRLPRYMSVPKFYKWQLTVIAYRRWITGIDNSFMHSCFFNILFIVSFLFRVFWLSTFSIFMLLRSLIQLYKNSGAFPIRIVEVSKDDIDKEKVQFDESHSHWEKVKREVKWKRLLRKLSRKNQLVSSLEFWSLHLPISFYIGLVSFMSILMTAHFIVNTVSEPNDYVGAWVVQGWSSVILIVPALFLVILTSSRSDPMVTLAYGLCCVGVAFENTWGTCYWYLSAGIKVRKPDADRINQMSRDYYLYDDETREKKKNLFGGEIGGRLMWFWNLTDDRGNELGENHRDGAKWCKHWVEKGGFTQEGRPWAFRHIGKYAGQPLKYYIKDVVPDGDYVWHFGRCRRIFKDIDGERITKQEACNVVGQQDEKQLKKRTVKGYAWLLRNEEGAEGHCVEDPSTCPFKFPPPNAAMITQEYEIAQVSILLATFMLMFSFMLCRKYRKLSISNSIVGGKDGDVGSDSDSSDEF